MSVLTAKPVFVGSVLMAKPVFVVSVGLRVFQNNLRITNFLSIWKIKLYYVRCMKYFSLGILRHNYDFVGPFNLTISYIKVIFWVFLFMWVVIHPELHHKILRSIVLWNKLNMTYCFWVMAKKLLFVTSPEKSTKNYFFLYFFF